MAKKKSSKSDEVRAILEKNPKMPVKEIQKTLADKGIKASYNLVYGIKAKGKAKKRKMKRQKAMAVVGGNNDAVQLIKDVRALADRAGGIKALKELVEILGE